MLVLFLFGTLLSATAADIDNYVVNGEVSPMGVYKWQLSLRQSDSHICGAVVYNERWAVTAAHCVNPSTAASAYSIKCGLFDRSNVTGSQRRTIRRFIRHPNYSTSSAQGFPNDIAVLEFESPLVFNEICDKATFISTSDDYANTDGVITGWGRLYGGGPLAVKKKLGYVKVLSHTECAATWGSGVNSAYHICILDKPDYRFMACNGDSGGPLQVNGVVLGVASWVASGCIVNYPGGYTRYSTYRSWVESTISANS